LTDFSDVLRKKHAGPDAFLSASPSLFLSEYQRVTMGLSAGQASRSVLAAATAAARQALRVSGLPARA